MSFQHSSAFRLQAAKPVAAGEYDPKDETLAEMVQSVFPLETEDAVLDWAGIRFALNYKYDISMMLDDILELLRELKSKPSGTKFIY